MIDFWSPWNCIQRSLLFPSEIRDADNFPDEIQPNVSHRCLTQPPLLGGGHSSGNFQSRSELCAFFPSPQKTTLYLAVVLANANRHHQLCVVNQQEGPCSNLEIHCTSGSHNCFAWKAHLFKLLTKSACCFTLKLQGKHDWVQWNQLRGICT